MNVEGFSYETWYNMPVRLRNHYVVVIRKQTDAKNKQMKQQEHRLSNIKGLK